MTNSLFLNCRIDFKTWCKSVELFYYTIGESQRTRSLTVLISEYFWREGVGIGDPWYAVMFPHFVLAVRRDIPEEYMMNQCDNTIEWYKQRNGLNALDVTIVEGFQVMIRILRQESVRRDEVELNELFDIMRLNCYDIPEETVYWKNWIQSIEKAITDK